MAVRIRLTRIGSHKRPFYRIVVANASSPRDGKYIEKLGTYDPFLEDNKFNINVERCQYWLKNGAQPTKIIQSCISKLAIS